MRALALLALFPLAALAQSPRLGTEAGTPEAGTPAVHALPFESSAEHAIELAVGGAEGERLRVEVAAAPGWVRFVSREGEAVRQEEGEPVARLAFALGDGAPVGEVGVVRLSVVAASGEVWAEHEVRLEVAPPREARLDPVRPNPTRGRAVIGYVVPASSRVRLSVVDVLGREVAVLADGEAAPGAHEAQIPTGALASGVYAVVLIAEGEAAQRRVRRMTVVR